MFVLQANSHQAIRHPNKEMATRRQALALAKSVIKMSSQLSHRLASLNKIEYCREKYPILLS